MIISFCGHSDFCKTAEYEKKMFTFFDTLIGDQPVEFYLGGYGNFDFFAYDCGNRYQKAHPNLKLVFVTPYLDLPKGFSECQYDEILYPPLEQVPKKFAIIHRNRFMMEQADVVIAYIEHTWGGAYQSYQYAKRKGKTIFNLAEKT